MRASVSQRIWIFFGGVEFGDFSDQGFGGVGVFEDEDKVGLELVVKKLAFELGNGRGGRG